MGLDAYVYCDCFERGRLRTQPRPEWGVYVHEEGWREPTTHDLEELLAFDAWNFRDACEHEDGVLLHHRLGNIGLIALFRQLLNSRVDQLPVIVNKIIYSGIHSNDSLTLDAVERLAVELDPLAQVHDADRETEALLRDFEHKLRNLVECARRVQKPIVF